MTKIFTIQIAPIRAPYMRCKQVAVPTVCKKYVNGKVEYHEFRWNNPKAGRNIMWKDTPESEEERQQYAPQFAQRVQRAYDKAVIRFYTHYKGIKFEDEIVRVYAPYPDLAPNATITVYSQRVHEYKAHQRFLEDIVSKMNIQFDTLMSLLQRGQWDRSKDSLYKLNKYMFDLQSMCRPDHHVVEFKGKNNPLTANRR
tara:strand:+ start:956 stop:1549 length:594 start_codon:yes stop_codon:yes gene_type:complete